MGSDNTIHWFTIVSSPHLYPGAGKASGELAQPAEEIDLPSAGVPVARGILAGAPHPARLLRLVGPILHPRPGCRLKRRDRWYHCPPPVRLSVGYRSTATIIQALAQF